MAINNITGADTLIIAGSVINDFADGEISSITFPNEIAKAKTGKNGNTIWAQDAQGTNADLMLRIMRGSSDDINLQNMLISQQQNFPSFTLLTGQFVKQLGDGQGNTLSDIYNLLGGAFTKNVEVSTNVEGGTDQSVAIYHLKFAQVARAQQ